MFSLKQYKWASGVQRAPRLRGGRAKAAQKHQTSLRHLRCPWAAITSLMHSGDIRSTLQALLHTSCLAGYKACTAQLPCEGDTGSPLAHPNSRAVHSFHVQLKGPLKASQMFQIFIHYLKKHQIPVGMFSTECHGQQLEVQDPSKADTSPAFCKVQLVEGVTLPHTFWAP